MPKTIDARKKYKHFETVEEAEKCVLAHGGLSRFAVWDNVVYAREPKDSIDYGYVPIKTSSRYPQFKALLDEVDKYLENNDDGSWCYSPKLETWFLLPLSFIERVSIAKFDERVTDNLALSTPTMIVFPDVVIEDVLVMHVDELFSGEIRTGSMVAAVNHALNHNIEACNLCMKQALSWGAASTPENRIQSLTNVALKIKSNDVLAAHILTEAIVNQTK